MDFSFDVKPKDEMVGLLNGEDGTTSMDQIDIKRSNENGSTAPKKKRKKRPTGVFKCDNENCDKVFTRAEHLARHKLNHNPTVIYTCPWEGCTKSFVRSDLKERHIKRHEVRKLKDEAKALLIANGEIKKRRTKRKPIAIIKENNLQPRRMMINSLDSILLPNIEGGQPVNIHSYDDENHISAANDEVNALKNGAMGEQLLSTPLNNESSTKIPLHLNNENPVGSPSYLINWLFDENSNTNSNLNALDTVPNLTNGNFYNPEDDPFGLSSNLLNDILIIPPNFPNPIQQTLITSEIIKTLVEIIPEIANHEYLKDLNHFLELFWSCFHIQYPILHRPSFNTFTCPPILLLTMIMTGASYATTLPHSKFDKNPREFADLIAEPIRFKIFQNKDFQPPAQLYIIQSLLLLENYERLSTNRMLHERAYVYHGITIQLLRRSPGLGGNPLNNKTEYITKQNDPIWEKWINFEMLKRTALFAFFIDTTHSIIFGYQITFAPQQIQLNLPCDDDLWESYLTAHEIPKKSDTLPFLTGLKRLINREHVSTSRLGKKILLSGLLSVMFQMQQRDLQESLIQFDQLRDTWKDTLSLAFDFWNCDIMKGCCSTESHALTSQKTDLIDIIPLTLRSDDTRCKNAVYHMAQITLRIQHYDYYIYAGAPWRMNVEAEASDYELVDKKVAEWSRSPNDSISVIYAYLFLFEMFLSPQDSPRDFNYTDYTLNSDALFNRANVFALVAILVWAYNYSLNGPESDVLKNVEYNENIQLIPKEDGYQYLRRIRNEFTKFAGEPIHVSKPIDAIKYHNLIRLLAHKALPNISNKHHMAGLLMMISKIFKVGHWEVGTEFSRLIWNICKRSFGSTQIRCEDMYESSI